MVNDSLIKLAAAGVIGMFIGWILGALVLALTWTKKEQCGENSCEYTPPAYTIKK